MRTVKETVKIFRYYELSEKAREKVMNDLYDYGHECLYNNWNYDLWNRLNEVLEHLRFDYLSPNDFDIDIIDEDEVSMRPTMTFSKYAAIARDLFADKHKVEIDMLMNLYEVDDVGFSKDSDGKWYLQDYYYGKFRKPKIARIETWLDTLNEGPMCAIEMIASEIVARLQDALSECCDEDYWKPTADEYWYYENGEVYKHQHDM